MNVKIHTIITSIFLWLITLLPTITNAAGFSKKDATLFACILSTTTLNFDFETPKSQSSFWYPVCHYEPLVGTLLICYNEQSQDDQHLLEYTYNKHIESCSISGGGSVSYKELEALYQNATKHAITLGPGGDKNEYDNDPLHNPVHLNFTFVSSYMKSYTLFFANFVTTLTFCDLACGYWLLVLITIGLFNFMKRHAINKAFRGRFLNRLKAYTTIPTLFGGKHFQPWNIFGAGSKLELFECLLPTTQEAIIILIYFLMTVSFCVFDYSIQNQSLLLGSKESQLSRYIADRTGLLAFAQLPPLFLFGGRNNILIKLTDIPFNSFIIYHKWISRFMVLLAFVHAHAYAHYFQMHGTLEFETKQAFWKYGERCLLAGLVILLQGVYYFRKRWYEIFLVFHITLALIFIIGAFLHCRDIGFLEWVYVTMFIWGLDRIWRIVNIVKFGGIKEAHVKLIDETMVVTVPKPKDWESYPGCYVYLYILSPSVSFKIWQSHPFTIYSAGPDIKIYMKKKEGMTLKLFEYLMKQPDHEATIKVAVEGPYGHHTELTNYDSVLLIAGGNGVPGPYYHAMHQLNNLKALKSKGKDVLFIWIAQHYTSLYWFKKELGDLQEQDPNNLVNKFIYLTRENNASSSSLPSMLSAEGLGSYGSVSNEENVESISGYNSPVLSPSAKGETTPLLKTLFAKNHNLKTFEMEQAFNQELNSYKLMKVRPDVNKLIRSKIQEYAEISDMKSMAVVTCGADQLADKVRDSIGLQLLENTDFKVDLFEELQVW